MPFFKGHSLSDNLDDVQRAEMKAYMELVNNMLLTAEVQTSTAAVALMCSKATMVSFQFVCPPLLPSFSIHSSTSSGAMMPQLEK